MYRNISNIKSEIQRVLVQQKNTPQTHDYYFYKSYADSAKFPLKNGNGTHQIPLPGKKVTNSLQANRYFLKTGEFRKLVGVTHISDPKLAKFTIEEMRQESPEHSFTYDGGEIREEEVEEEFIELNSPMTIQGGDVLGKRKTLGFSSREQLNIQGAAEELVAAWAKEVNWRFSSDFTMRVVEHGALRVLERITRISLETQFDKFMKASGHNGRLDYKAHGGMPGGKKKPLDEATIYEINGVYYNKNEAGNFWWGYSAAGLNMALPDLVFGGDEFSIRNGMAYDEPWEVDAVTDGYIYYFSRSNPEQLLPKYKSSYGANRIDMYKKRA